MEVAAWCRSASRVQRGASGGNRRPEQPGVAGGIETKSCLESGGQIPSTSQGERMDWRLFQWGLLVESITRGELPLQHGRVQRPWGPSS